MKNLFLIYPTVEKKKHHNAFLRMLNFMCMIIII